MIAVPEEDAGKAAKNGDFSEGDDGDDGDKMDWQDLFKRAQEDMAVVTAMMREAAVDGVTLRVEGMHVPDCDLRGCGETIVGR